MASNALARPFFSKAALISMGVLLLLGGLLLMPQHAHAAVGAGGNLPWEDPFTQLRASVTGPVAFTVSIVGLIVAFSILIFGGELNAFFRTFILIVLVVSVLVAAQNVMANYFGRGAEIALIDATATGAEG
ncbi:TrbC/VirB2 family protein [Azohydromonas lata]|uniref:TrbC/VirB2 family protein n=1 Tax=Azohydromonas lata TaxID=45677 RepID=A0ABU5IK81_9BURK|nr:TrbC/VirB2 family protein [Azohydromonas lata]MDZ5459292.1 TrbC/VirB2 family protein [Azohydromonas lata]